MRSHNYMLNSRIFSGFRFFYYAFYLLFVFVMMLQKKIQYAYPLILVISIPSPYPIENIHPATYEPNFHSVNLTLDFAQGNIVPYSKNPSFRTALKEPSEYSKMP